jgi:virulence factor Mce-like protein
MRRGGRQGINPFAAGAISLVVVVVAVYFGFTKAIPFQHHFTIHAAFRTANNIKKGSLVRIAGINVGKVTDVHFLSNQSVATGLASGQRAAVVSMRIDNTGLPLHTDATVRVRPRIFLEGNFFADISPGSPSAPILKDGGMIPVNQTSAPVQIDQVLSILKTSTRDDLRTLLYELSRGFGGQGGLGFNRSLQYQPEAYRTGAIVSDATLGTAQHDLSKYINYAGATAAALDRFPAALKSLITDFNTTANALAVQQANLSRTIADLPPFLRAAMPALAALNRAFPPLRRFIHDFRPATRSSLPAINASIPFAHQLRLLVQPSELRGLVHDLRPTVPSLVTLNQVSVPLYQQVRLASSCQNSVILPWSQETIQDPQFPSQGPNYQESLKALVGTGGDGREFDANGLWNRVLLGAGNFATPQSTGQFLLSNLPIAGGNPPPPSEKPPLRPDVPCETQQSPDLRSIPLGAPSGQVPVYQLKTPAAQARWQELQTSAVNWLKGQIDQLGLKHVVGVSSKDITASQVPHLKELGKFRR